MAGLIYLIRYLSETTFSLYTGKIYRESLLENLISRIGNK